MQEGRQDIMSVRRKPAASEGKLLLPAAAAIPIRHRRGHTERRAAGAALRRHKNDENTAVYLCAVSVASCAAASDRPSPTLIQSRGDVSRDTRLLLGTREGKRRLQGRKVAGALLAKGARLLRDHRSSRAESRGGTGSCERLWRALWRSPERGCAAWDAKQRKEGQQSQILPPDA